MSWMSDSRRWDTIRSALRWRSRGRRALLGAITLTIALSAGLCATAFVVLDGVLWKPLPYQDAGRLVYIRTIDRMRPTSLNRVSGQELLEWQRHSRTLVASGGFEPPRVGAIEGDHSGALVRIAWVTHDLFPTLGVKPLLGRAFDGPATRTNRWRIVISYRLWLRHFGGDRAAIGRTMRFTTLWGGWEVIGVMPPSLNVPQRADAWILTWSMAIRNGDYAASATRPFGVVARLHKGVSLGQAQDELRAISDLLASRNAIGKEGWTPTLTPLRAELVGDYRRVAIMFGAACGLLLVIACAVLVNLAVASVAARRTELAIRLTLGAGRGDLLLLVATDFVVCAAGGCALALLLAGWFVPVLGHAFPAGLIESTGRLSVTASALGASLGLGLLTLVAGLATVSNGASGRFSRVTSSLRGSSVSGPLRRSVRMLTAQIAPTVALVLVGTVSLRTLAQLYDRDYGFDPRGLIVAQLAPPSAAAFQAWKGESIVALIERLRHRHGIEGAEVISWAPFDEEMFERWFDARNEPSESSENAAWTASESFVTPGYFRLMGVRLAEGRVFDDRLDPKPPSGHEGLPRSVVVSRSLADRLWSHASAVGRTLGNDRVIGVVEDMSFDGVQRDARPRIYYSFRQRPAVNVSILMRAPRAADATAALRQETAAVFGGAAISGITTGEALLAGWLDEQRLVAGLLTVLAALCLALATIGTSFLLWSTVQRGRREVAIRLAIGGRTPHIVRWLYRTIGWPLALGTAAGAAAGIALVRFVSSVFFGLAQLDAVSTGISLAVLAGVALLAGIAPMLAVTGMDPIRILQSDS
jgi:predicted permease